MLKLISSKIHYAISKQCNMPFPIHLFKKNNKSLFSCQDFLFYTFSKDLQEKEEKKLLLPFLFLLENLIPYVCTMKEIRKTLKSLQQTKSKVVNALLLIFGEDESFFDDLSRFFFCQSL